MAILGAIVFWGLAVFGFIVVVGFVGMGISQRFEDPEPPPPVEPPKPQPQITNLRWVTPPASQPKDLPVLQKTTMQITTTKYVDPTRNEIEASK